MKQPILEHARMEGERIVLRPLSVDDVATSFELVHGRTEITDWLVWNGPKTPEELVPWYENWARHEGDGANYHFAIVEREARTFHGAIGLRFIDHPFQADLGYWLDPDRWGRGYMSEAVEMVTWLAFEHLATQLAYALVFEGNAGSVKVLERAGFRHDPLGTTSVEKKSEVRTEEFYGLSRADWEKAGRRGRPIRCEVDLTSG